MPLTYPIGNLLDAPVEALVNTVNTVGVMGKGIALQFKELFPGNFREYARACKAKELAPGKLLVVQEAALGHAAQWIINFPTKTEWRQKSRYEYIEAGLAALVDVIRERQIRSIALPPLGCGNGGLDWVRVKSLIEQYLTPVAEGGVEVQVYEPNAAVKALLQKEATFAAPELTPARAMLLWGLYTYEQLGERASLFAANKLAYFLQTLGEPLRLTFKAERYGPYADGVRHVLYRLNGAYLQGLEQQTVGAFEPLHLQYDRQDTVRTYINSALSPEQRQRLRELLALIEGFESTLSLEVLASVAYLRKSAGAKTPEAVFAAIQNWTDRKKRLVTERHVRIAFAHLDAYQQKLALA